MKRHLSDSENELNDEYEECSSPDTAQVVSRKKRRGIIEKRRRDRINNCLMELRRLVPAAFEKQGSAKLEKAEILQMTVDHLRHLHQSRDPRGFTDPLSAYSNTRAFLDYRVMGFRECVAEVARYTTNVEGLDMKDPLRVRLLNHLENFLAQRELAINAAVAASSQMGGGLQKMPATIAIQSVHSPFIAIPSQRSSPNHMSPPASLTSPDGMTPISVGLPTPVISFATTATVPVFGAAPIASVGTVPPQKIAKLEQPPTSPSKSTKAPFRPWAND